MKAMRTAAVGAGAKAVRSRAASASPAEARAAPAAVAAAAAEAPEEEGKRRPPIVFDVGGRGRAARSGGEFAGGGVCDVAGSRVEKWCFL
jgi:hypothetical protein